MDVEVGTDRLSSLPDDLIHKILSFLKITEAIGNSVLSRRWRYIWTSMPYLSFTSQDFSTLPKFSKFVMDVLSRRNNLAQVHSLKLSFRGKVSQVFVKRVMNYAVSHNVQQLNVVFFPEKDFEFPLSLVSSQSIKHLSLKVCFASDKNRRSRFRNYSFTPTSTWELPALTTLDLDSVALRDDEADKYVGIFSKCANLKNLTLRNFKTMGSNGLCIFHPRLTNLTLASGGVKVVNVVAPQLKNLSIRYCNAEFVISAPDLASLLYKGPCPFLRSTDGFHSLEKADIFVFHPRVADAHQIVCLLQQLHHVHFLTLNLEMVEFLSSSVELVLHQPSPFVNLKGLKIYPNTKYLVGHEPKNVAMSPELKSYLLDGSPGCTFTLVLREEITAHELMAELRMLLEKEKDNIKTNKTAHVESQKPKKLKTMGNLEQMKGYWENLGVQIELRKKPVFLIISKLQRIEEIVTKLPASNMAKIQPCFSSLCEEVNIVIGKITDCMKIHCDENQSRSSVCLHELATTLESLPN